MIQNTVKKVVYGRSDTRLRATWRVLLAIVAVLLLPQLFALIIISSFGDPIGNHLLNGMMGIVGIGIFLIGFVVFARYIDRRPLRAYGLTFSRSWWLDSVVGFLAPLVAITTAVGAGVVLGWMSIESVADQNILFLVGWMIFLLLVYILAGAILEGIVYAGLIGQNIAEGIGEYVGTTRIAVVIATVVGGILFSLLHFVYGDPAAFGDLPLTGPFLIWLATGMLMILSYFWTGRIAFAIGANAGGNIAFWIFQLGEGLPGIQEVVVIEHTPPAPFDLIGGTVVVSMILAFVVLTVWTYYRTGSVTTTEETVSAPQVS